MSDIPGVADSFEHLVAPHERQVYFTCLRMMGNPQDAQDAAQETMLKAFRAFQSFRGQAKVSTWLYTIATRCCLDMLRQSADRLSLDTLRQEGWEVEDDAPSPYVQMELSERKRLLSDAVSHLPGEQRAAVVLCDLQGLSYEEAARALDCPQGTLKSRLHRARAALRQILSGYGELFKESVSPIDERRKTQ